MPHRLGSQPGLSLVSRLLALWQTVEKEAKEEGGLVLGHCEKVDARAGETPQKGNRAVKALDQAWQHLDEGAPTALEAAGWTPSHPQPPPGLEAKGAMSDQEYTAQSLWNGADEAAKDSAQRSGRRRAQG